MEAYLAEHTLQPVCKRHSWGFAWAMVSQAVIQAEIRALAGHLVTLEAAALDASAAGTLATCSVCEKLRLPLGTLAGAAGFNSLLSRALTLARRESPALSAAQIDPGESLEGIDGEAQAIITAHLLNLLIAFIGETLTMRILLDFWPDLPELGLHSPEKDLK